MMTVDPLPPLATHDCEEIVAAILTQRVVWCSSPEEIARTFPLVVAMREHLPANTGAVFEWVDNAVNLDGTPEFASAVFVAIESVPYIHAMLHFALCTMGVEGARPVRYAEGWLDPDKFEGFEADPAIPEFVLDWPLVEG